MTERFKRIELMIGSQGLEKLKNARVLIVGLGAVGSYAVEALARGGVGSMRLADFDVVTESNINRQLFALHSTLGKNKTEIAAARVKDINPDCCVEEHTTFVHTDTFEEILDNKFDVVIDAIDSLNPKVHLLAELVQRNIPVVSSMGAALRTDPSCIRVAPLKKSTNCPLAKRVRKRLNRMEIAQDFMCVYSNQPIDQKIKKGLAEIKDSEKNYVDRGRQRQTLGSLPTITGMFGLAAANTAIEMILEQN